MSPDPEDEEGLAVSIKSAPNAVRTTVETAVRTAKDPAARAKARTRVKDGLAWAVNRAHPALLRVSKGRLGASFLKAPVLLLTTTGRKSGKERTVPLLYLTDGQRLAIVASYGGDDRDPAWLHNLRANPAVTVEIAGKRRPMTASIAGADDRARLWPRLVAMYKHYDNYQANTDRTIPVVWLDPA